MDVSCIILTHPDRYQSANLCLHTLQTRYHHLKCEDLVNSLDKSGFPCASSGKTLLEGHKVPG